MNWKWGAFKCFLALATQVTGEISNFLISLCMPLEFSSTEGPRPISSAHVNLLLA